LKVDDCRLSENAVTILSTACDSSEKAELLIDSPSIFETMLLYLNANGKAIEAILALLLSILKESTMDDAKARLQQQFVAEGYRLIGTLRVIMHNERSSSIVKLLSANWYALQLSYYF
jgi:hypothetical protein